jgi:hypothetical protein
MRKWELWENRARGFGFGPYTPMLRDDGTPYSEDEDDALLKEQEGELFDTWTAWCPKERTRVIVAANLRRKKSSAREALIGPARRAARHTP